jgi:hypothetical protein
VQRGNQAGRLGRKRAQHKLSIGQRLRPRQ